MYDIVVIGAGVIGCSIARELSRYNYHILVLDKNSDLCEGTSKANSGIVHAGYDAKQGSLMAKMNVLGNQLMPKLCEDLDVSFVNNGSLVLCFDKTQIECLEELKQRGISNGVKGLEILTKEEVLLKEPHLNHNVVAALYAPSGGIVCPFELTIALGENACSNGVTFQFNSEVIDIKKQELSYLIKTKTGDIKTSIVINAAGVHSDDIHNFVEQDKIKVIPRKGEYCLLDKECQNLVSHTIFQLPNEYGKGILVTPTVHGNIILGPTAVDIDDKENHQTTKQGLFEVLSKAGLSLIDVPTKQIITSFTGVRAHREAHEFLIEEAEHAAGFFDVAGIESPGLASSPAIGQYVANMVTTKYPTSKKENFISKRKRIPTLSELSFDEQTKLIKENPLYANIVCRCEMVSEGEIVEAIHRPLGATTVDGIKRRTRAGMGRCQAGFCLPKTIQILARELNKDISEITKTGEGSYYITGYNKEDI